MSSEILIFDFAAGRVVAAAEHPTGAAVVASALRNGPGQAVSPAESGPVAVSGAVLPACR